MAYNPINQQTDDNKNKPLQPRRTGSGFTNIQKVLGAAGGNKLSGAVAGGIQQQVGQTKQAIGTASAGFKTAAEEADKAKSEQFQNIQNIIKKAGTAPEELTEEEYKAYQDYSKYEYGGPKEIQSTSGLTSMAKSTAALGSLLSDKKDAGQLTRQFASRPGSTYTKGQERLDVALLGRTEEGRKALAQAKQATTGLERQVESAQQSARALAGQKEAQAGALRRFASTSAEEAYNPLLAEAEGEVVRLKEQRDTLTNLYSDTPLHLVPESVLKDLGLEGLIGLPSYGATLGTIVASQDPTTAQGLLTLGSESVASAKALERLAGKEGSALKFGEEATPYNPFEQMDIGRVLSDIKAQERVYTEKVKQAEKAIEDNQYQEVGLNELSSEIQRSLDQAADKRKKQIYYTLQNINKYNPTNKLSNQQLVEEAERQFNALPPEEKYNAFDEDLVEKIYEKAKQFSNVNSTANFIAKRIDEQRGIDFIGGKYGDRWLGLNLPQFLGSVGQNIQELKAVNIENKKQLEAYINGIKDLAVGGVKDRSRTSDGREGPGYNRGRPIGTPTTTTNTTTRPPGRGLTPVSSN